MNNFKKKQILPVNKFNKILSFSFIVDFHWLSKTDLIPPALHRSAISVERSSWISSETYEIDVLTKLVDVRSNEHNIVEPN